jgi:hypothetical protein
MVETSTVVIFGLGFVAGFATGIFCFGYRLIGAFINGYKR